LLLVGADQLGQRAECLVHERQPRGVSAGRAKLQELAERGGEGRLGGGVRRDGLDEVVAVGRWGTHSTRRGHPRGLGRGGRWRPGSRRCGGVKRRPNRTGRGQSTARSRGSPRSGARGLVVRRQHGARLIGIAGFGGSRYGASRGKSRVAGGAVAGILGGSGAARCSVAVRRVWALCCVRYTGRGAGLVGVVTVGQGFVGVALAAHAAQAQPTSQRLQATIDTVE